MAYTKNAWGHKRQHKTTTATKTYEGTVNGEKLETTATTEGSAKTKLKIKYNRKYGFQDHVFRDVTITSVR